MSMFLILFRLVIGDEDDRRKVEALTNPHIASRIKYFVVVYLYLLHGDAGVQLLMDLAVCCRHTAWIFPERFRKSVFVANVHVCDYKKSTRDHESDIT